MFVSDIYLICNQLEAARAMEEGGVNDTVSLMNVNSRKLVTGTVQAGGWVLAQ